MIKKTIGTTTGSDTIANKTGIGIGGVYQNPGGVFCGANGRDGTPKRDYTRGA